MNGRRIIRAELKIALARRLDVREALRLVSLCVS